MKQFAPCIISKAKVALTLTNRYKGNVKTCSDVYWEEVVKHVASSFNVTDSKQIKTAISRTDLYKRK